MERGETGWDAMYEKKNKSLKKKRKTMVSKTVFHTKKIYFL